MTKMKRASHVWWRNDHDELTFRGYLPVLHLKLIRQKTSDRVMIKSTTYRVFRLEKTFLLPPREPGSFDISRAVGIGHRARNVFLLTFRCFAFVLNLFRYFRFFLQRVFLFRGQRES